MTRRLILLCIILISGICWYCSGWRQAETPYDTILRGGTIYDGSGGKPYPGDVAIGGDTIAAIGDLGGAASKNVIEVEGMAISPGFINMLSWADGSLLEDGRSMSDIKQGVTLEVFGEGLSAGPKKDSTRSAPWQTLGDYFELLEKKGASPNFASFVGATTVRSYVLGDDNVAPSTEQLEQMRSLVRVAMREGAMGLGSSLIYAPADYASTEELIELSKVASEFGGMYISHIRNENDHIYEALNELFRISREASIRSEIYHLKINQEWNWKKIDTVIFKIDSAQKAGLAITADMYTYNASGTGLLSRLPTWVQDGGMKAMRQRLRQPSVRKKVLEELELGIPNRNSDPSKVLVMGFRRDSLNKLYRNMRLDQIALKHGKSADETMIDLILADRSSIPSIYFLISEDNVRRMLQLPYVSICSDGASRAAEKPFTEQSTHPRVYGSFARLLGKYVREEKLMSLEEAVRRMSSLPATNLRIERRGTLKPGNYADLVVFDPLTIADRATFDDPHQYASGVIHVFVNGTHVLRNGEHLGAFPGRCIRGPGWKPTK